MTRPNFTINTNYDKDQLEQLRLFVWRGQNKSCACGLNHMDSAELTSILEWALEKLEEKTNG